MYIVIFLHTHARTHARSGLGLDLLVHRFFRISECSLSLILQGDLE